MVELSRGSDGVVFFCVTAGGVWTPTRVAAASWLRGQQVQRSSRVVSAETGGRAIAITIGREDDDERPPAHEAITTTYVLAPSMAERSDTTRGSLTPIIRRGQPFGPVQSIRVIT